MGPVAAGAREGLDDGRGHDALRAPGAWASQNQPPGYKRVGFPGGREGTMHERSMTVTPPPIGWQANARHVSRNSGSSGGAAEHAYT